MTFKEKWELDHPGEKFSFTGHGTESWRCPYKCGYEKVDADSAHCEMGCTACWNREMPSLKAATMAFGNHPVEVPYSGRNPIEYVDTAEFANAEPHILDSGERREFETGAVRDIQEGKGRCDLMPLEVVAELLRTANTDSDPYIRRIKNFMDSGETRWLKVCLMEFGTLSTAFKSIPTMLLEVAKHFEEGAKKYGESNWQKGLPVHCYIDSAVRHYLKWLRGDKDEPHDRAFVWNLLCCIWECDFSPRAKMKGTPVAEEATVSKANPSIFYICNRKPCATCRPDCHSTIHSGDAAVLELYSHGVRYEDCPIGLFMHEVDGVFLKTEIINAETGQNTAVHIGLGLSRKFEPDAVVFPIKHPFEVRDRV